MRLGRSRAKTSCCKQPKHGSRDWHRVSLPVPSCMPVAFWDAPRAPAEPLLQEPPALAGLEAGCQQGRLPSIPLSHRGMEGGQKESVLQAARPGRNAPFPDKPARLMLAPISSPRHGTREVAVQLSVKHLSVPSALGRWVRNRTRRDTKRHEPPGMKAHKACTLLPCCTASAMTGAVITKICYQELMARQCSSLA